MGMIITMAYFCSIVYTLRIAALSIYKLCHSVSSQCSGLQVLQYQKDLLFVFIHHECFVGPIMFYVHVSIDDHAPFTFYFTQLSEGF